jgi:hypothetical protein
MLANFAVDRRSLPSFVLFTLLPYLAIAQQSGVPRRIGQPIDEANLTVLHGNTHPLARTEFDVGTAPASLPMERMLLVLKRSPEREVALTKLLVDQQNKTSPSYHQWLTPEQFGKQFGPTDRDIQTVIAWLESHGFEVTGTSKGRTVIEFSGSASQVQEALHTVIHKYVAHGEAHWANAEDPQIPTALAPVVAGIDSLNNFGKKPLHHRVEAMGRGHNIGRDPLTSWLSSPGTLLTTGSGCGLAAGPCYLVTPYDLATIYDALPLWDGTSPIDGTGQTIAIVSQSDIYPDDFKNFRSDFGLPTGTLNIIYNGTPPAKLASQGDELESDLDVEWAGALAKGATIDLVASTSTDTTAGVDLSALYIVDNNLAPIMSESYGACELDMGTAGNQFYNQLWQQAAAEGITVFVSTGDSGSAVCDRNSTIANHGLAVNGIASTPYNIAVGGTDFADLQNQSKYWNSSNDPTTYASAKGYVPESSWNDTCTNSELFVFTGDTTAESQCNDNASRFWPSFLVSVGGSGGASNCTTSTNQSVSSCAGGYDKPAWQTGPGVPNDGKRDLPDVSLFAADGMNSSSYLVCETDIYGGCAGNVSGMVPLGGTSASAPAFAGIMALVNQKMGSRQGNANYVFYPLAARPGSSCDSASILGSTCIFYDVTTGTVAMPCATGSPDCVTNTTGDRNGVLSGYGTTAGYDLATGLGSVDVTNLVSNWSTATFQPTVSTLSLSPTTTTHGALVSLSVSVAPQSGVGVPSGQAFLLASTGQPAGTFTLANGTFAGTTRLLPGGSYDVIAHYAGDGTYGASDSSPAIPVTVGPEASVATLEAFSLDQNGNRIPFTNGPYGGTIVYLSASVAGKSGQGIPTGTVNLTQTLNGTTTNFSGDPFTLNSQAMTMLPFPGYNYWAYAPGTYTINATYSGDASFTSSSASSVGFTITQAQTNTTSSVPGCTPVNGVCIFNPGNTITIFANVSYSGGAFGTGGVFINQPTGTITFYSNGTALGPPVPVDSNIVPPVASINTTQLLGSNSITAQYSGDSNFLGSTSSPIIVEVGETFGITASPTTINVASPGQSGSTTLTFTAQNGFTGSATLTSATCSNLPPKSSCSFNPATVTLTSSAPSASVVLTISTTAATAALAPPQRHRGWQGFNEMAVALATGICVLGTGRRRYNSAAIVALLAVALIVFAVGCGAGASAGGGEGGGGGGGGGGNTGTPPGNYTGVTVTVMINGTTQSISNLTVNVQ